MTDGPISWQIAWLLPTSFLLTYVGSSKLIIQTSLDFTIFTAADAFARLFSNACTILQHTTDDDTENDDDSNEDASSS